MKQKKTYYYQTCGINSTARAINEMVDQAREVKLATLERHCVDLDKWKEVNDYSCQNHKGFMKLEDDYAVSFHKSKYLGRPCYYMVHSSIEYIWVKRH